MSTFQKTEKATEFFEFGENGFQTAKTAARPFSSAQIVTILSLGFLAVLFAGILTLQPAKSSSVAEPVVTFETQGNEVTKVDRAVSPLPSTCEGQAWGAWSADCAAAITGATSVRKIGFVTIEKPSKTANETILARFPQAN